MNLLFMRGACYSRSARRRHEGFINVRARPKAAGGPLSSEPAGDAERFLEWLRDADAAMYRAKARTRGAAELRHDDLLEFVLGGRRNRR